MIKSLRPCLILLILCCAVLQLNAQHSFKFNTDIFEKYQDSLIRMGEEVYSAPDNQLRFAKNAQMIKTLVNVLKQPNSFTYEFDSLKSISIMKSPDKSFRIFTWQVPVDGGTYRYFGTIQLATADGKLKLYPLIDDTDNFKDNNQLTTNKNWYGARYYEILPVVTPGKPKYYVLLGWKGHTAKVSRKVVEILSFDKERALFGKNVFDGPKASTDRNRIVFEYSKLNSMTLTFDQGVNMIVYDHLAPISPDMAGNFEYYASDLSFDAYRILGGRLKLIENVELKNDPNELDEMYIDPNDKNIPVVKKY
jgi:hypothetical protein